MVDLWINKLLRIVLMCNEVVGLSVRNEAQSTNNLYHLRSSTAESRADSVGINR